MADSGARVSGMQLDGARNLRGQLMMPEADGQLLGVQIGWRRVAMSRWAPLLTHVSLVVCTAAMFATLLRAPLWIAIVPCAILEHRIGILLHEYIHGIPFKRRAHNLAVITFYDGLMICFGLLELFRNSHLTHHRWLNTERDPAWIERAEDGRSERTDEDADRERASDADTGTDSRARSRSWIAVLASLELPQHVAYLWSALGGRKIRVSRLRVLLGALMSVGWIVFWIAIGRGWIGPVLVGLVCFTAAVPSSLRGAVEHHSFPGDPRFSNEYRTLIPLFNLNRHIHHHIDTGCPWYRLRFVTPSPLPARCFVTHWFEVYVRRRYAMMAPMRSDWRAQLEAGAALDATRRSMALPAGE
jgi:fatty acid desaturase